MLYADCITGMWVAEGESLYGFVQKQRLADIFDFGDGALQIKCLAQNNFEYLSLISMLANHSRVLSFKPFEH